MRRVIVAAVLVGALLSPAGARAAADPLRPQQWGLDLIKADPAHAVSEDLNLTSDTIDLRVNTNRLQRAYAWGASRALWKLLSHR